MVTCRALELFVSHRSVPVPQPGARCNNSGGAAGHGRLPEGHSGPGHQQDAVPAHPCSPPCYLPRAGAVPPGAGFCSAGSWSAVPGIMPQVNLHSFIHVTCVFPWGQVCTTVSSSLYAKGHPCVSPQVQASALLGVGLLCQRPCHNVIAGADSKLLQAACLLIVPIFDVRPTSHSQPIVKRN